jgi:hypothetical protein
MSCSVSDSYNHNISKSKIIPIKKKLPIGPKWLLEKLTYLSKKDGYFWGSNEYLAGQFDVDKRTIKRWIFQLKNHGLITTTQKNIKCSTGWKPVRKIYISNNVCEGDICVTLEGDNVVPRNESFKEERMNVCKETSSFSSLEVQTTKPSADPQWRKKYDRLSKQLPFKLCETSFQRWFKHDYAYLEANVSLVLNQYSGKEQFNQEKAMHRLIEVALRDNYAKAARL